MPAHTAIVVVNYRSHELLGQHLLATTAETTAVVVVVDSFSSRDEHAAVAELAAHHGWELVSTTQNRGFGAGMNLGVRRARERGCDVFVLLNPDLEIAGSTVDALADSSRADPEVLCCPRIVRPDGRLWSAGGTLDLEAGTTRSTGVHPSDVRWLSGACLAISAQLWDAVDGFDEDYFLYWEDVDLSWKVRGVGGRLVVRNDLSAVHAVGGTQDTASTRAKSLVYYRHNCRGRMIFAGKHLDRTGVGRWARGAGHYAWQVVLRGGRRQLLRSRAPLAAAALGSTEGLLLAARRRWRAHDARPPVPAHPPGRRRLLVAHPSPDLYGSDRQMLETVAAALDAGWSVEAVLPTTGPLVALLRSRGASVRISRFPVLRKSVLRPRELLRFVAESAAVILSLARSLRRDPPDVVYVNTLTIPVWLIAARLAGIGSICHVHEAEDDHRRIVASALVAPLALADAIIANSQAARRALQAASSRTGRRAVVVFNGVPGPADEPQPSTHRAGEPWRLALVARLSPRKGVDVALEAAAILLAQGRDVHLAVCGTVFPGYEWFEAQLRERIAQADLVGHVELLGYVHPTWPVLASADVVLVPSRLEPFGNTAVEGLLARRAVVASGVQGLAEVLTQNSTGLLVPPADPGALAGAIARLLDDPSFRSRLADQGRSDALARFGTATYADHIRTQLERVSRRRGANFTP